MSDFQKYKNKRMKQDPDFWSGYDELLHAFVLQSHPKSISCHSFQVQYQELFAVQLGTFSVTPSWLFYSDILQSATPSFLPQLQSGIKTARY